MGIKFPLLYKYTKVMLQFDDNPVLLVNKIVINKDSTLNKLIFRQLKVNNWCIQWVFWTYNVTMNNHDDEQRYARQMALPEIGEKGQQVLAEVKLKSSSFNEVSFESDSENQSIFKDENQIEQKQSTYQFGFHL